jgi:UDP-N-acetylglucosamine 2-epimerase (non-hydrolysing)
VELNVVCSGRRDVTSTLACALVAVKAGTVVAHIGAGLRSRDWNLPEEINRVVADRVSDLHLAVSQDAVQNMRAEGYHEDQTHLSGKS